MARPAVSPIAEDLYEALGAWAADDEAQDWALLKFCDVVASMVLEKVDDYFAERSDELPGWRRLLDPENAPAEVLPYLAQFAGVVLEPALTVAQQRQKIATPEGFLRGTPAALIEATKRTLTGAQDVVLLERYTGDAYQLAVRTQVDQTPDADATLAAILTQKPIGIVLDYAAIVGETLAEVDAAYPTLQDIDDDNPTLADVLVL